MTVTNLKSMKCEACEYDAFRIYQKNKDSIIFECERCLNVVIVGISKPGLFMDVDAKGEIK